MIPFFIFIFFLTSFPTSHEKKKKVKTTLRWTNSKILKYVINNKSNLVSFFLRFCIFLRESSVVVPSHFPSDSSVTKKKKIKSLPPVIIRDSMNVRSRGLALRVRELEVRQKVTEREFSEIFLSQYIPQKDLLKCIKSKISNFVLRILFSLLKFEIHDFYRIVIFLNH